MSVSLKKPSNDIQKVDLTKPPMSGKLPECTPIHLIDEEDTIKSRVSQPKISDIQIRLGHSEEEEREICDLWGKAIHYEKLKRVLNVVAAVVLVSLVVIFVCNFKLPDIELKADSGSDFFASVSAVYYYLADTGIFHLFLGLVFLGFGFRCFRRLLDITRK